MHDDFEKITHLYNKIISNTEKSLLKNFKNALTAAYALVGEQYLKYSQEGQLNYFEMSKYNRMEKLFHGLDNIVNEGYKSSYKDMKKALGEIYLISYDGVREIVQLQTDKRLIPIVRAEVMQRALTNDISGLKWTQRMNLHRDTAVLKIRETVANGLHHGETYSQMSERLNEALSRQVVNPMRIVRTEGHRVFSEARRDSIDGAKGKVKMTKTWITSKDERVRGQKKNDKMNHIAMDGMTIPYEDDFELPDGSKGFGPGMIGDANDINCRCDWIIDFIEETNNESEYIKISNEDENNRNTADEIRNQLDIIPEKHKEIIKDTVNEVIVVDEGNSRYDRAKGIMYILKNPEEGEVIHELAHAIETKLDLYNRDEFKSIVDDIIKDKGFNDFIYDLDFAKPIIRIESERFISEYQGHIYNFDMDDYQKRGYIETKQLGDYFTEGYRVYVTNPELLREKDIRLYNFIDEELVKVGR